MPGAGTFTSLDGSDFPHDAMVGPPTVRLTAPDRQGASAPG